MTIRDSLVQKSGQTGGSPLVVGADGALSGASADAVRGASSGLSARSYSNLQKAMRPVRSVTPSQVAYYVDFNRGADTNNGTSMGTALKTIEAAIAKTLSPGAVIALANDSYFDQALRVAISGKAGNAGAPLWMTNYDPGGYPSQRPTLSWKYKPTAAQWTWDATRNLFYYQNPNGNRYFSRSAYVRFPGNAWGIDRGLTAYTSITKDYEFRTDDAAYRIYVYSPPGIDPTTYYGGPGSVVIGEAQGGVISFTGGSDFWVVENLRFDECGYPFYNTNTTAAVNSLEFRRNVASRCSGLIVTSGNPAFGNTYKIYENTCTEFASAGVHLGNSNLNCEIDDNVFIDGNNSFCTGGGVYINEYVSDGSQTAGTRGNNKIRRNYCNDIKNGLGDNDMDGCGIYVEQRAHNTLVEGNVVENCAVAFQDNSGKRSVWTSNIARNCNMGLAVTDASAIGTVDITFDNNTIFASKGRNALPWGPGTAALSRVMMYVYPGETGAGRKFSARGNVIVAEPSSFTADNHAIFRVQNGMTLDLTGNTLPVGPNFGRITDPANPILPDAAGTQRLDSASDITGPLVPLGVASMAGVTTVATYDAQGVGITRSARRGALAT